MGKKNTSKIDLVRQMLAKAESTTPEEAEALTEAALKLMAKHGIDDAMLAASKAKASGAPKEEMVKMDHFFPSTYAKGLLDMAYTVGNAMKTVKILQVTEAYERKANGKLAKGSRVIIFGYASDVERAHALIVSLHEQADRAMKAWWVTAPERSWMSRQDAWVERRSFYEAFGYGVAAKLRSIYTTAMQESASGEASTALVLRDRKSEVESAAPDFFGRIKKVGGGPTRGGYGSSWSEGRAAGERANVGQTELAN